MIRWDDVLTKTNMILADAEHEIGEVIAVVWPEIESAAKAIRARGAQAWTMIRQWTAATEAWAIRAYGPVEASVANELNRDEVRRVWHKTVVGVATGTVASYHEIVHNADFLAALVSPVLFGLVCWVFAYIHHKGEGMKDGQPQ